MLINFIPVKNPTHQKQVELAIGQAGLGIFWPTKAEYEFMISDPVTMNGIDVECEALREITAELCKVFECLAFDKGRTHLEVIVALTAAKARGELMHIKKI
jgi:hypothetical protein